MAGHTLAGHTLEPSQLWSRVPAVEAPDGLDSLSHSEPRSLCLKAGSLPWRITQTLGALTF